MKQKWLLTGTALLLAAALAGCGNMPAADQAAKLSENGEAGLLRLAEIWCAMHGVPAVVLFEGSQAELLASVVAQIYAYLLQTPFDDPAGLSLYVELQHMMAALMLGEWYE